MLDLEEAAEPRSQFGKTAITTRREWRPRGFGFTETGPELTPRGPQPAAGTWVTNSPWWPSLSRNEPQCGHLHLQNESTRKAFCAPELRVRSTRL